MLNKINVAHIQDLNFSSLKVVKVNEYIPYGGSSAIITSVSMLA